MKNNSLPAPDNAALAHSQQLTQQISATMQQQGGTLSFTAFMQLALYSPGLGYYHNNSRKLGSSGDFITAPELSPLFSQCLAQQCSQIIPEFYSKKWVILEFGAGSGVMAADILRSLATQGQLPNEYWILELSATLQAEQRQTLQAKVPDLLPRVRWLTALPTEPFVGIVLANEVLDAMPVARFEVQATGLAESHVGYADNAFYWQAQPCTDATLAQAVASLELAVADGYCSELNLALTPWLQSVSACLAQGLVLLIDYGFPRAEYYHPQRDTGTLICHYRHHSHTDPLILVGLQDITAHVDFTAVAEAALAAELQVAGYTNQANFLLACGLTDLLAQMGEVGSAAYLKQAAQAKTLIMPSEMGELFKVMALTRQLDVPLLGFGRDERGRL